MEAKKSEFRAEIAEMLDLVVNSLYSRKEIFLRELISNGSDAIDRAKFLALTDKTLVADNPEWAITIAVDKTAKTLMISDNGTGMDAAELEQNLGTIASSGTKKFREMLKEKKGSDLPELIGQFGVGFYAAFMVADKVTVETLKRGTESSFKWESDMGGTYTISDGDRDFPGTSITLHLRDDQQEYLDKWRVQELVKKYSDFIAYPIYFKELNKKDEKDEDKKRREEDEKKPLNTMVALWKRAKKDVKQEEYDEFYKHLTHDWEAPFETIPFSGEGAVEFKALLFLPKKATMEMFMPNQKRGLSLYVRNVFIGDDIEMLLPSYLRFVRGVVDSSDLPLNVSREMLQDDAVIAKIKSAVTKKVLSTLEEMKKKDAKKYGEFFAAFGTVLKEGVHTDWENADRLKKLLMYPTARGEAGKRVFLEDYVKDMAANQKDIYYFVAEREEDARRSPQLEAARKHGYDVLLWCDPVDEYLTESLRDFDGKKFVDVAKGEVAFGDDAEQKAEKEANEKATTELKGFIDTVKKSLEASVSDVRVSNRLTDSACCLVAQENAMPASMVRMMKAMNQPVPDEKRILELNATHPLVTKIAKLEGDAQKDAISLLYDSALIAEGSPVADGAKFAKLLADLMLKG